MPWVVEFKSAPKFPPGCTYCRAPEATDKLEIAQLQATGASANSVSLQESRFAFPACTNCATKLRKAKAYGLGAIAFGGVVSLVAFPMAFNNDAWSMMLVPTLLIGGGIAAMVWRMSQLSIFRILHVGRDGVTYGLSREDQAKQFAEANGTSTTFKRIVVKM